MDLILLSNTDLAQRMQNLEREGSLLFCKEQQDVQYNQTCAYTDDVDAFAALSQNLEEDLKATRVYRKAKYRFSTSSLSSSILHDAALSVFSKLSLAEVSYVSVYALPVYSQDLSNSIRYQFGVEDLASERERHREETKEYVFPGELYQERIPGTNGKVYVPLLIMC